MAPNSAVERSMCREPHINPDQHLPSALANAQTPATPTAPAVVHARSVSPPVDTAQPPRQSSPPPTAIANPTSLRDYLPHATSLPPSLPGASALAGSSGPLRPRRISAGSLSLSPAAPAVAVAGTPAVLATVPAGGSTSTSAERSPGGGGGGGDDGGSGTSGGIFSTLRSRVGKLPFRKDNREAPAQVRGSCRRSHVQLCLLPIVLIALQPAIHVASSALASLSKSIQVNLVFDQTNDSALAGMSTSRAARSTRTEVSSLLPSAS